MLNDDSLPFIYKISNYAKSDFLCCDAQKRFANAAVAAKKVCDDALEASKLKAQKEVQKAVAAAAAAALKREKEAAALREGGIAADAVISTMDEQPMDHLYEIQEGKDDHFITLPRVKKAIEHSIRSKSLSPSPSVESKANGMSNVSSHKEAKGTEENKGRRKRALFHTLPMPDARVLDFRLKLLLREIEKGCSEHSIETEPKDEFTTPKIWPASDTVLLNQRMRDFAARFALESNLKQTSDQVIEYSGIGLNGTQCGVAHRTVDDRTDFSIGAASPDLYQVAHGPESPRYLRALGVPMTFGRFGMVALVHADEKCMNRMLENEHKRIYRKEKENVISKENDDHSLQTKSRAVTNNLDEVKPSEVPSNGNGQTKLIKTKNDELGEGSSDCNSIPPTPTNVVPAPFQDNATLRAGVSTALLYFGYPLIQNDKSMINCDIWENIRRESHVPLPETSPNPMFDATLFQSLLQSLCGDTRVPKMDLVKEYIEECLLPHCLKLCLYGNSSTTRITRGSKGEYKTFEGTNSYPEPTETLQSPVPDPCLPLIEQSIEAVGMANAIIRRVRLMRCILKISSDQIQINNIQEILHSKTMRKSMDGLPVWWCPWIHDAALLVHASTRGLFSVLKDRGTEACPVFSSEVVKTHIERSFFDTEIVPGSITDASSLEATDAWIESHANEFPSLNVIERRLAFLCAKATENNLESESRFDNLPMYDHGGWPRN